MGLIVLSNFVSIVKAIDYELGVNEQDSFIWEVTKFDEASYTENFGQEADFAEGVSKKYEISDISEKIFMIGKIENLQIVENIITFNPINIWYFGIQRLENETVWYFGNNKDADKIYCYNESNFKGIITNGFIFGQGYIYEKYRPIVTFQKEDNIHYWKSRCTKRR